MSAVGPNKNRGSDELFLRDNLYPQMNGKVFIHSIDPLAERRHFIDEPVHSFPPIAKDKRGFLNRYIMPVGLATIRRTSSLFTSERDSPNSLAGYYGKNEPIS